MDEAWQRAVETALAGEDPSTAQSLMLDSCVKCSQGRLPPRSLLEPLAQLTTLSIANTGISTLADFPRLSRLEQLSLSDNRISGGLDHLVEAGLHSLRDLDLSNNKIQHIEDLSPLTKLGLVCLDLYECPVTRVPNYRAQVFGMIKSLKYLDKVDADNNERPESEDEDSEDEDGEDANSEGVDDEDVVVGSQQQQNHEREIQPQQQHQLQHANGQQQQRAINLGKDEDEDEELDEEEEEESFQEVVASAAGAGEENGSDYEEVEDEEDEDGENVVEVHDVRESDEEELAAEEEDEEEDGEDEEGLLEQTQVGSSAPISGSAAAPVLVTEGELEEVQEEDENGEIGEDDDEDEDAEEEEEEEEEEVEEDYGTDYLVQPITQQEDEGASDFEPGEGEDEEDDEEFDEDGDEDTEAAAEAIPAAAGTATTTTTSTGSSKKKRSREEGGEGIVDTRERAQKR